MKLLTYTLCQSLSLLGIFVFYAACNLLASHLLIAAHVSQLTPMCALICLLLGLCSAIAAIKRAHTWAITTIKRQHASEKTVSMSEQEAQAEYERQHTFATSLTDGSYLFTGRDTVEGSLPAPAQPVVSYYAPNAQESLFQQWCQQANFTRIAAQHPPLEGYALLVTAPNCATYHVGTQVNFEYLTQAQKNALMC